MYDVTVLFKSGGKLEFQASHVEYSVFDETKKIAGYGFKTVGTHTAYLYLDVEEIAGLLATSDEVVVEPEEVTVNE